MAIAGLIRPSSEASDGEFARILGLADSAQGAPLPPFLAPPLRVQQSSPREPAGVSANGLVRCWIEGRIYNGEDLRRRYALPETGTIAALLAEAHARGTLERMLPRVDGDFFAVIHDDAARKLILVTDRLGLRPVYTLARSSRFFFCGQLRGFLGLAEFSPRIAAETATCFLDLGHLVGDKTWFEGVDLLPPATWLEVDARTARVAEKKRYWSWSGAAPRKIGLDEAAEELARLLRQAVTRRIFPGEKAAVLLSGGLDSRAILGCVPPELCAGTATFGQAGCRDVLYAERAARAAGVPNRLLLLTRYNWDLNRLHAVWKCDGMSSPADLSGSQFSREMRALGTVNLNGFAGDLVAGGSYLKPGYLNAPADAALAAAFYGPHAAWAPPDDDFLRGSPHTDAYVLAHRVRRLTIAGTREVEDLVEQRKPFMDSDLLDFLYSLPEEHRRQGKVYHRALLRLRPDLFANIPWQKTGLPLSAGDGLRARLRNKALRLLEQRGWGAALKIPPAEFQDTPRWLAASSWKYRPLLEAKDALWPNFTDASRRERFDWNEQLRAGKHRQLLHAIGLEAWLQQVFNGRHREPEVPEYFLETENANAN